MIDYESWRSELISEIEAAPHTTGKGDLFVQRILRDRYQLSEDDAVNATDSAGAGDHGIDALYIEDAEGDIPAKAVVLQGKYGAAGSGFSPYHEFKKFHQGLKESLAGRSTTDALQQCANILKNGGLLQYLVATIDPLSPSLRKELEDVRVLANEEYRERLLVEAVSLRNLYDELHAAAEEAQMVKLACQGVFPRQQLFLGAATLVNVYRMLRQYADMNHGIPDGIYDRNVRKWLGKRGRSVNAGIVQTLKSEPQHFVAYNNGITMVCSGFYKVGDELTITSPQIVNGCQTTRTLFDFMENRFPGLLGQLHREPEARPYREAFLPFKLITVEDLDSEMVKKITRYSNRQNAVRGRDFLTLEDEFQRLKKELKQQGYYLEVQTGEYGVLPKSEQKRFPRSVLVNAFDALRFYGAGVLAKPHVAFGRSGEFTPGGDEFDTIMEGLQAEDLLIPWLIAQDAQGLGYSVGSKWKSSGEDHRNQTRYFFLNVFFRVVSDVMQDSPRLDLANRSELYRVIQKVRDQYVSSGKAVGTPFHRLLQMADGILLTYMNLAKGQSWYEDRNAFLKREDLLKEDRLVVASGAIMLQKKEARKQIDAVLNS